MRRVAAGGEPAAFTIVGLAGGSDRQEAAGIVVQDTASALFGAEGLQVTGVEAGPYDGIEVRAVTDWQAARACPECGTVSDRVHEMVLTRPRDVRRAAGTVALRWARYRRKCGNPGCPRKTFTEWVPQVPPRCRITARLRDPPHRALLAEYRTFDEHTVLRCRRQFDSPLQKRKVRSLRLTLAASAGRTVLSRLDRPA